MNTQRDEGAVMIWVALMMVVLLGVGAIVIDIGALYAEKRQLQNGADAAALAVAQDCANADCGDYATRADTYADLNAKDGAANVALVCGVGPGLPACAQPAPPGATGATGWVRVQTSTETSGGGTEVDYMLGGFISSFTGETIEATAVAAYGALGSGSFVPLVFSMCEYIALGGSWDGTESGTFPAGNRYVYFHGVNRDDPLSGTCPPGSPSGQDLPGGFGRAGPAECVAGLTQGQWVPVNPGNDLVKNCDYVSWQNQVLTIAVYDEVRGTGNNGEYHIAGFVGMQILGYRLGGNKTFATAACPLVANASVSYLCGNFQPVVDDGTGFGNGNNYGASVIKMVG